MPFSVNVLECYKITKAIVKQHAAQRVCKQLTTQKETLMSIKELVQDEAVLSTPCEKATAADAEVAQDLLDTMASLDDAACLHANQIGVTHNLFAYVDEKDRPHVMFNPVIKLGLAASKQVEGCFTHEEPVTVTRFDRIKVTYEELVDGKLVPRKGDFRGWVAQLIQHMADHGKGKYI